MANSSELWDYVEGELKRFRPAVFHEFDAAARELRPRLSYEEYVGWAHEGVAIARSSFRASEAAAEYFKASVPLLRRLRLVQFNQWARIGRSLLRQSPALAAAYYRASPVVLGSVLVDEFDLWATAGQRLFKDTWRGQALATQFFDGSPELFRLLSLDEVVALAEMLEPLSRHSPDRAAEHLDQAGQLLAKIEKADRMPALRLGAVLAEVHATSVRPYLEATPKVLERLGPRQRRLFIDLVAACARDAPNEALALYTEGGQLLADVDPASAASILDWANEIASAQPAAGISFFRTSLTLLPKLGLAQLDRWRQRGVTLLRNKPMAALAYFRLQLKQSRDAASDLSRVCELDSAKQVLRMYCKGLCGREVKVLPTTELVGKGIGWTAVEQATSDGSAVFLPSTVEDFPSRAENFALLKVLATHQAGHLEFGTYDFDFDRPATLFDDRRPALAARHAVDSAVVADFERFFDLFTERHLAKLVFVALEDGRVDCLLLDEYAGIRSFYRRVQRRALQRRPSLASMPLRAMCLDILVRLTLGEHSSLPAPGILATVLRSLAAVARRLWRPGATVEDSAEATILLYDLLLAVPNIRLAATDSLPLDLSPDVDMGELAAELADLRARSAGRAEESTVEAPERIDFRGDLKPELVQALMRLRQEGGKGRRAGTPISAEALQRLLEKNAEIEISGLSEGEARASTGLFVNNLLGERGKGVRPLKRKPGEREADTGAAGGPRDGGLTTLEIGSFNYDEWDFRAEDYRSDWCRVSERALKEGDATFYQQTLHNHAALVGTLRKQFELLRPELFKKIKRLPDGEEFDLDDLIEAVAAKRCGRTPSEKIYWRRNKVQRDVAVVFLLDMSASTDEQVEENKGRAVDDDSPPRRGKRIIDVEKESLVLLTQALQAIGDRYGIYGFSGYGRDDCEYYVVKDINEEFGDRVKRRIDKIAPMRGTRMGAAIRHATSKLADEDARLRILVLLSDGYPQDHDYHGSDRNDKEYALHDTRAALLEAKRKKILPFCLTVDKGGHDYLKTMCADIGYEVVDDVRSLPRRLPALYRLLTT